MELGGPTQEEAPIFVHYQLRGAGREAITEMCALSLLSACVKIIAELDCIKSNVVLRILL